MFDLRERREGENLQWCTGSPKPCLAASVPNPGGVRRPPPTVVAQQDRWKVQPEAEGYQGGKGGPAFAKERRLRAGSQVVLGARGKAPQSRKLHPRPQRPARKLREGAAPPERQGQRPSPFAPHTGGLSTLHWGAGSRAARGRGAAPVLGQTPPALSRTPGGGARSAQAAAASA